MRDTSSCLQILGGQVEAPVEFLPLYDVLATMQSQCAMKTEKETKSESYGGDSSSSTSTAKSKGMFKKLFSKKG